MFKRFAAFNPFAKRPYTPVTHEGAVPTVSKHPHNFSCPCANCTTETARLTAERLRLQAPGK